MRVGHRDAMHDRCLFGMVRSRCRLHRVLPVGKSLSTFPLMIPRPVTNFHLLREHSCNLVAQARTRQALRKGRQIAGFPPRPKTDANHARAMPHAVVGRPEAVSARYFSQSFWFVGIPFGVVGIPDGWALHSRERMKSHPLRSRSRKPCQRAKSHSNKGPDPSTPEMPVKPGVAVRKSRRCQLTRNSI